MSEEVPRVEFDKSTWGDGPWQTEPDRVDWMQGVYRALPYVRKTVNRCARALAAMMEPRP